MLCLNLNFQVTEAAQREREKEGDMYADKEKFVTSAFRCSFLSYILQSFILSLLLLSSSWLSMLSCWCLCCHYLSCCTHRETWLNEAFPGEHLSSAPAVEHPLLLHALDPRPPLLHVHDRVSLHLCSRVCTTQAEIQEDPCHPRHLHHLLSCRRWPWIFGAFWSLLWGLQGNCHFNCNRCNLPRPGRQRSSPHPHRSSHHPLLLLQVKKWFIGEIFSCCIMCVFVCHTARIVPRPPPPSLSLCHTGG